MALQRYDVAPTGQFTPKLWSLVNSPILDERDRAIGVLHHVEDLSDLLAPPAVETDEGVQASAPRALAMQQRAHRQLITETSRLRDALTAMVASHALCSVAVAALDTVDGVAVSLRGDEHQELIAASGEWAWRAEQLDYLVGEGPAQDATETGLPVHIVDLNAEAPRWPGYVPAAAEMSISGVSAFPITMGQDPIGTISFYRHHSWPNSGRREWIDTVVLADLASVTIVADHTRIDLQLSAGGSVGYHDVAVAAGLVSAQLRITFDAAMSAAALTPWPTMHR